MLKRAPEYAQSVKKARSGGADRQVYVCQTRLPRSTWVLQTCVTWKSSRICGIKLEVFRDPGFSNVSSEWIGFDVDVSKSFLTLLHTSLVTVYAGSRRSHP